MSIILSVEEGNCYHESRKINKNNWRYDWSNKDLKDCKQLLQDLEEDNKTIFIEFGLKQIFVDFFITVENLTSMILKELKKYKIGIDMKASLIILVENKVIGEETYEFLNGARLLRNRISHRYKEPF